VPNDHRTLREARAETFERGATGPMAYDRWLIKLDMGGVGVWVPNPPAHGAALRLHDLHHILTGYDTSIAGEAELSAFELGSGCGRYVAAFGFDLAGTGLGALIAPRRTFRAFVRGRASSSLFRRGLAEAELDRPVGEMQAELGLDRPEPAPTRGDVARFAAWSAAGLLFLAAAPLSAAFIALTTLAPTPAR